MGRQLARDCWLRGCLSSMCLVLGGLAQDVLLRVAGRVPSQHELLSNSCLHHVTRMSSPAQMEGTETEGEDSWPHFATHKARLPRTLVYSSSTAPMTGRGRQQEWCKAVTACTHIPATWKRFSGWQSALSEGICHPVFTAEETTFPENLDTETGVHVSVCAQSRHIPIESL